MKIGIIGTGYVGLVTGSCLADFGHFVTCMDINPDKIAVLQKGYSPIYEPELDDVLKRNIDAKRLSFTTDIQFLVENHEVIFIAVGTPPTEDGSADLTHVLDAASEIGQYMNDYKVIVTKSTVPIGTARNVTDKINSVLTNRNIAIEFDVVSNPEFLREGKAIQDFSHPDRIVIGTTSAKAETIMKEVYRVLSINQTPFICTNPETSEMIKYASNAFLAVKISFINELALVCEKTNANVQDVAKSMGMDGRISPKFLHTGPGFGGSCFPKDTRALVQIAKENDEQLLVVEAAIQANEKQKQKMVAKIVKTLGSVSGKTLTVLGLSFKPDTDDMREAPALTIITDLVHLGAKIQTYCPGGMKEAKKQLQNIHHSITYCENEYDAAQDSHAIILMTEWNQFRGLDLKKLKNIVKDNYFFDLRNIYSRDLSIRDLFRYYGVGIL